MKSIILRIKQSPLLAFVLIFGLAMSILLISLGTSFVSNLYYGEKAKNDNAPPNRSTYSISFSSVKNNDNDDIKKLFNKVDKNTGVLVNDLLLHLDGNEANTYWSGRGEYFTDENVWHIPIKEGKYYTVDDVKKGNKVALIGSNLEEYVYEKNNSKYIKIDGDEYSVIGTLGFENQSSPWDGEIAMPYTSLPQKFFDINLKQEQEIMSFFLYNNDGDYQEGEKAIENQCNKVFNDFRFVDEEEAEVHGVLRTLSYNPDTLMLVAVIGYIITLIFAVNITLFWIEKRKYEISIRKAFGFTNPSIIKMIFGEMIGFAFIAFVAAVLIQLLLNILVGSIADYTLKIYFPNLMIGFVVVILTATITSIIPAFKAIHIQPAEALKRKKR